MLNPNLKSSQLYGFALLQYGDFLSFYFRLLMSVPFDMQTNGKITYSWLFCSLGFKHNHSEGMKLVLESQVSVKGPGKEMKSNITVLTRTLTKSVQGAWYTVILILCLYELYPQLPVLSILSIQKFKKSSKVLFLNP